MRFFSCCRVFKVKLLKADVNLNTFIRYVYGIFFIMKILQNDGIRFDENPECFSRLGEITGLTAPIFKEKYSIALTHLDKGGSVIPHFHREADEIYIFVKGRCQMKINEEVIQIAAGTIVVIEPEDVHEVLPAPEEVSFYAITVPPYKPEDFIPADSDQKFQPIRPQRAFIEPDMVHDPIEGFPETIVSIFSKHLFDRMLSYFNAAEIAPYSDVDGTWPVYRVEYKGKQFAFAKARLGAPACAGSFEDMLAMGGKRIILMGNCGVLDNSIEDCGIIIPRKAIRDEGTSFHYAASSGIIEVNKKYTETFREICDEFGYSYTEGTTWTTDAFYRETPEKIAARKALGAICVEMECSAMQALCDFRNVEFFQFLYAGDNLDHSSWDPRSLDGDIRLDDKEKIALLAFELAVRISRVSETGESTSWKAK